MLIHPENITDPPAIHTLVIAAFRDLPHSSGTEAAIIDGLRADAALTLSLVATEASAMAGHVAFSPVTVADRDPAWFGLGPLAVRPDFRRQGIGRQLIEAGLHHLRKRDANGCVVLGDPAYYARFGFEPDPTLFFTGAASACFQCLRFKGERTVGEMRYHPAFGSA